MKIAVCFYGLVGSKIGKNGKGENLDPAFAYKYYKKHIFDVNNEVDVFIHSWSYEARDKLIELYNPKKECIEKQMNFDSKVKRFKNKFPRLKTKIKMFFMKLFNDKKYNKLLEEKNKEIFRAYSRWYSSKKVLELKKECEKKNSFKYDAVLITRLDVGFFKDLNFSKYDMNYFYASNWNDSATKEMNYQANYKNHYEGIGFLDFWFFSNSKYMDKFALLYDEINNYDVNPHRSSRQHVDKFIGKDKVRYTLFRWFDHEMIRRKFFEARE